MNSWVLFIFLALPGLYIVMSQMLKLVLILIRNEKKDV